MGDSNPTTTNKSLMKSSWTLITLACFIAVASCYSDDILPQEDMSLTSSVYEPSSELLQNTNDTELLENTENTELIEKLSKSSKLRSKLVKSSKLKSKPVKASKLNKLAATTVTTKRGRRSAHRRCYLISRRHHSWCARRFGRNRRARAKCHRRCWLISKRRHRYCARRFRRNRTRRIACHRRMNLYRRRCHGNVHRRWAKS